MRSVYQVLTISLNCLYSLKFLPVTGKVDMKLARLSIKFPYNNEIEILNTVFMEFDVVWKGVSDIKI